MTLYYSTKYESPAGIYTAVSDGKNLVGLWLEGQKYFCAGIDNTLENNKLEIFYKTKKWLDRYFDGKKPEISEIPLAPKGNEFRQRVWKILCTIPYGRVTTYGRIAGSISDKMSAQAVGGAVGHNPISIIIPCHRVTGADGKLTGYAGGLEIKRKLLELEGVNPNEFFRLKI